MKTNTKILIETVPQFPELCFDPCAGQGSITKGLRGLDCMVSDIDIEWGLNCPGDATTVQFWEYWADSMRRMPSADCRNWATVTHPPINLASQILPLAYEHSPWGVAFLLRLSDLEPGGDHIDWLKAHADNFRYLISGNPLVSDTREVAWMVWQRTWSWRSLGIRCPFVFNLGGL
jgi:hypothetical protein